MPKVAPQCFMILPIKKLEGKVDVCVFYWFPYVLDNWNKIYSALISTVRSSYQPDCIPVLPTFCEIQVKQLVQHLENRINHTDH